MSWYWIWLSWSGAKSRLLPRCPDLTVLLTFLSCSLVCVLQIVNETIPALKKIKESGKTRFIGITGLPLEVYTYVLDRVPIETIDVVLSYCHYCINDSTLEDLIPYLKSKGVGVINASPLSMGLHTANGPPEWHPASSEIKVSFFYH